MNWAGLNQFRVDLKLPLILICGNKGILACGYLNVDTFDKTGEAGAIVSGVRTFDDMLTAKIVKVSKAAQEIGIQVGATGIEALEAFR